MGDSLKKGNEVEGKKKIKTSVNTPKQSDLQRRRARAIVTCRRTGHWKVDPPKGLQMDD